MAFINVKKQPPKSFDDIKFQESIGVSSLGALLYDDVPLYVSYSTDPNAIKNNTTQHPPGTDDFGPGTDTIRSSGRTQGYMSSVGFSRKLF